MLHFVGLCTFDQYEFCALINDIEL